MFSPLQFIIILAGFIFFLFAIDAYSRKKLNGLHFLVFFGGTLLIIFFSLNIVLLDKIGGFFGLNRGADLLVYMSIITLAYFYFELLNKITKNKIYLTSFVSNQAIEKVISHSSIDFEKIKNKNLLDEFVFLVRAYNEQNTIIKTLESIIKKGFTKIIIVNDGSGDNTGNIVKEFIQKNKTKNMVLLTHLINRGGGAANKTGFEFIKKYGENLKINWIVTFDADGQMEIDDMDRFMKELENGHEVSSGADTRESDVEVEGSLKKEKNYDILLGSRFISGGRAENIPTLRRIILFGSKIITYLFNGLLLSDPHNGYRVISFDLLKKININSDNMTYASELVEEINRLKARYKEIPVNIKYSEYSLEKGQKNSNAIKILLEIIYHKFFYK